MNNQTENFNQAQPEVFEVPKILTRKTKRLIFYSLVVAIPVLQFIIFYVYVNIESILMAFKTTELLTNPVTGLNYLEETFTWNLGTDKIFANFTRIFVELEKVEYYYITNALKNYALSFCTSGILSILFSYYVYKKFMFSGLFKVMLYLPSIVSSVVLVNVYSELVNNIVPNWLNDMAGDPEKYKSFLETDPYWWVILYALFMALGGHILMYTGTMSGINESVVESAQLDGVNAIQEFWYITLPLIYPTFVTFTVTGLATVLTSNPNLHTFFGMTGAFNNGTATLGYWIFASTKEAINGGQSDGMLLSLNEVSAIGLMITAVILPISLGLKKVMTKYGPSVD